MTEFKEVSGKLTWTMEQLALLATISASDSTFNAKFGAIVKLRELIDVERAGAWDEGFKDGKGWGAFLSEGYGTGFVEPTNPYV